MNQFQIYLLIGALVALIVSINLPRAWLWVLLGAGSFALSAVYEGLGLSFPAAESTIGMGIHPSLFGMLCDSFVVLCIYHFGQSAWEMKLWRVFQAMMLVNLLYLMDAIGPHYAYVVALEVLNWLALALISGKAIREWVRAYENGSYSFRDFHFRDLRAPVCPQRARPPWHTVRR